MNSSPGNESPPTLEAVGISKSFPGVRALAGVDLKLRPGRLNALMGENGAGKSTLMKVLAGVYTPDGGEVLLEGRPVQFRTPREAQDAGVAIIHQELNLAENVSVAENLFLGREPVNRFGFVDWGKIRRESRALLSRMGVDIDPDRPVSSLAVATKQVVEIAKALALNAKVLILDEPTSALTAQETEALFERIAHLKRAGVALAYITHRFEELDQIADDVTVFRDGRLVGERPYAGLTRDELVRMMIGADVRPVDTTQTRQATEPLLRVRGLTLRGRAARPVVHDATFDVRRGEVLGLFGLMGAGRTELLEALYGLHPRQVSGELTIDGISLRPRSPREALAAGIALVPEDRKLSGLVLGMSVEENITMASLHRVSWGSMLLSNREHEVARDFVSRMRVKTPGLGATVRNLSGGNQQKVVLAKLLATDPRVLLLDEPTRGIDVGAKQEVYALIQKLATEGRGVLVVSSEAPEVLSISDRVLVMCEGSLTAEYTRGEADEHRLIEAALPRNHAKGVA